MKKYFLIAVIFTFISFGTFANAQTTSSVTPCGSNCNLGYTPLEPIPGLTTNSNSTYDLTSTTGFSNLINAVFKILISAGALISVVSLTVGGVQYMVSGSAALKGRAIERVKASMWGMLLIAGIWIILNTINPQLLNFNFNPCPVNSSTCSSIAYTPGVPTPPAANISTLTPAQIQAGEANGTISGALVNIPNNTFTWTSGASPADINAQYATFANACIAAHGSIQSGPPTGASGETLSSVCVQQ